MNRRDALRRCLLALGISAAAPVSAFDLAGALGAAKSLAGAATLSDADLKAYYGQMSKQMDAQSRIAGAGTSYGKRLVALTKGLGKHDGLTLDFKVYQTREVNAFAMGNGSVRIYSGLMDLMTDDEIRYVIGHEMGHIKAGHSKKRLQLALAAGGLREAVSASGGRAAVLADSQLGELFEKVVRAQHSQSNENEADDYAMAFVKGKHYNPQAVVSALEKLDKLSGGSGGGWLATHPAPAERAERMRGQLA
ncbi:M48 family metallopeptidase [Azoarcus sp. L1K30]|uniref:M48 family metallopeptidase n=1 Tax=Azoarcus sp. L1K30 TaxID=2820277 RepID=UPI001B81B8E4|nr:M48 family metallopeptidase [Azoarcus sp. L1K30]MBR0566617.1 M48 family metallopeptidase [Azoarcus sp. L1K30]